MRRCVAVWTLLLFGTGGCGLEVGPGLERRTSSTRASFLTYNAGLAHGAVALAPERLPRIAAALSESGAEVLCLQEVWRDEDYAALKTALAEAYPYAFREQTTDTSPRKVSCDAWSTFRLDRCVASDCTPKGISASECVAGPCQARYAALPDECKLCLAANTAAPWQCALFGAKPFAYDGRNGLALFSRFPIDNASYHGFETALVKRGAIHARVGQREVRCTHLSAKLDDVPYPKGRRSASWVDEQREQLRWLADSSSVHQCTVLMGDLNAGPQRVGLAAELGESYDVLLEAGFVEPWSAPACTWCKDNPLAGSRQDAWLDHVMFRGCPSTLGKSYRRVLDAWVQLVLGSTVLRTRLSDHYGLLAELTDAS
ncbi:MAG: endonuclease/exonuclease/phosphatase family protein [Deltaproteobacteria bacterium]|nr:endonuclease/exonuclease/phosphatase family protein [Deltaproteobacteria bacterium]